MCEYRGILIYTDLILFVLLFVLVLVRRFCCYGCCCRLNALVDWFDRSLDRVATDATERNGSSKDSSFVSGISGRWDACCRRSIGFFLFCSLLQFVDNYVVANRFDSRISRLAPSSPSENGERVSIKKR